MNRFYKVIAVLLYLTAITSSGLYFITKFVIKNFGKVQLSQLLFHIRVGVGGGLTKKLIISGVKYGVQWIIIAGLLTYLLFIFLKSDSIGEIYSFLKNGIKKLASKLNKPLLILGIILAAISVKAFSFVDHNLHVVKYLTQKQSPFFEKNYARLDTAHFKNPVLWVVIGGTI